MFNIYRFIYYIIFIFMFAYIQPILLPYIHVDVIIAESRGSNKNALVNHTFVSHSNTMMRKRFRNRNQKKYDKRTAMSYA